VHRRCIDKLKATWAKQPRADPPVAAGPLHRFAGNPRACWLRFGFALLPPTPESRSFTARARKTLTLRLSEKDEAEISGGVQQATITEEEFHQELDALLRSSAAEIGFRHDKHHLVAVKRLRAEPTQGLQPIHWDHPQGERERVSCIVYGSHRNSTSLPIFAPALFAGDPSPSLALYLDHSFFHHVAVQPGSILFFRQSVPHHGTANEAKASDRWIIFSMFSLQTEEEEPDQDAEQHFVWQYAADATENGSELHEQVLKANDQFNPHNHYREVEWNQIKQAIDQRRAAAAAAEAMRLN
jgi:hypothetical protein